MTALFDALYRQIPVFQAEIFTARDCAAVLQTGMRFAIIAERGARKMTIDDLKPGQSGVISRVGGEGPLRLRFLDMGLIPGTRVLLQKVAPMGDPIQIQLRGYELTIRREDARKIDLWEENK